MTDQYFGITDTGKTRQNNEDAFIARQDAGNRFIIACVIDGVGGYAGGEIAAGIARDAILKRLEKPSGEIISMIIDCFDIANERIIEEKQRNKDYDMMSCVSTLAIADITNNQFYYAHVGDTRLYLLRDNSLVKISHDQSFVGFLEESGRLSEAEAMSHPKRNEINKALGFEANLGKNTDYIETGQSPFLSGDMLLLCSDGLTDMVGTAEITKILTSEAPLKTKGKQLIEAANHHGGKDNVTVVLVHNNKTPLQHSATAVKQREPSSNEPASRITETPKHDEPEPVASKSNKGLIAVLIVLLLIFAAATVYLYLQNKPQSITSDPLPPVTPAKKQPGALQVKLQKTIDNLKGNVLILVDTVYKTPIIISEAIQINRDTLLIKSKGNIVFQSDSGYDGAAIKLTAKCRIITLDSLSFHNFKTGMIFTNNNLALNHVRFL
ncbi:MAG: protein phosphatase 2C domain-containing protein, partial [Mucilaginibacter sp.]